MGLVQYWCFAMFGENMYLKEKSSILSSSHNVCVRFSSKTSSLDIFWIKHFVKSYNCIITTYPEHLLLFLQRIVFLPSSTYVMICNNSVASRPHQQKRNKGLLSTCYGVHYFAESLSTFLWKEQERVKFKTMRIAPSRSLYTYISILSHLP